MNTEPRIYVGTYSKYNNGSIAGAWVDLDGLDKESFYEACQELHKDEEDPEFMFQDFEGFPREFYGESGLDAAIWDWLAMDDNDREMLAMYCEAIGCDGLTLEDAQEAFAGNADSEADFCENLAEETEAVPKDFPTWISIDWEATWKCSLQYDYTHATAEDGTLWFFRR